MAFSYKMKSKLFLFILGNIFMVSSCVNENQEQEIVSKKPAMNDLNQHYQILPKDSLVGTWISIRGTNFQMVEILDSAKASVYKFNKWYNGKDTALEKIGYIKAKGNYSITYGCNIAIVTNKYTFYYFLLKDTLFEMAEPGRVDTLIKVYNDSVIEKRKYIGRLPKGIK